MTETQRPPRRRADRFVDWAQLERWDEALRWAEDMETITLGIHDPVRWIFGQDPAGGPSWRYELRERIGALYADFEGSTYCDPAPAGENPVTALQDAAQALLDACRDLYSDY